MVDAHTPTLPTVIAANSFPSIRQPTFHLIIYIMSKVASEEKPQTHLQAV